MMTVRWGIGGKDGGVRAQCAKVCKTKESTSQVKSNLLTKYKIQDF